MRPTLIAISLAIGLGLLASLGWWAAAGIAVLGAALWRTC